MTYDDAPQPANLIIKNVSLLVYTLEVLAMTYLISLDQEKFAVLMKCILCNR